MKKEPLVRIEQLVKHFKPNSPPAIDTLSCTIDEGKLVALAGPDGAGKTTLIRILAGLLPATQGAVFVENNNVFTEQAVVHRIISYMPQRFGLYEDLTVLQNLNLYADLQNLQAFEKEKQYEMLLHFTNLGPFQHRLARDLSGGMKQKLGLACTLLRKPKLLLLDEPTVGVDPISRRELWAMIFALLKDSVTVICSTSYLDEAEKCDIVLLLNKGKLLYGGPPHELTKQCEGRVFAIVDGGTTKRAALGKLLSNPEVLDGTIQGANIRLVTKTAVKAIDITPYGYAQNKLVAAEPRFEDAFIDLLGGGPKETSPLVSELKNIERKSGPVVEAHELYKQFGSFTAVNKVSFSVQQGEIFGLLGPNGAGKSTTFKMLCGLVTPTAGTAIISGCSLNENMTAARSRLGYMAQKFSLYDNMSVVQNLRFYHGIYKNQDLKIIQEMIDIFALQPFLQEETGRLPFGFKQRLALACAIMHNPAVLFLDEPTSGVDPITRREFWNHINGMVSHGVAIIVTTHFMDEAEYCDRIGLINQGRLIQIGTPDELKASVRSKELPNPTIEDAFVIHSSQKVEAC